MQECYERLLVRTDHPTVQDARLGVELLNKFLGLWAEPRLDEVRHPRLAAFVPSLSRS